MENGKVNPPCARCYPTVAPPFENEVITRNSVSWIALLALALYELNTAMLYFARLRFVDNASLFLTYFLKSLFPPVMALYLSLFYFFLALKKLICSQASFLWYKFYLFRCF